MSDSGPSPSVEEESWPSNYFNYFTEIEEHFRKARGTALFLLSPLDWALIENWKNSGVPLEAVLKGIDEAFEKWRGRKVKSRRVNSLAYCAQAVMEAAQRLSGAGATKARQLAESPFQSSEIREYLIRAAAAIRSNERTAYDAIASSLQALAAEVEKHVSNLEDLERHLTALEDKMVAIARSAMSEEELLEMRRRLDSELSPYRGKMTAAQISMLERRYLDTRLLEKERLPRLSLFYMH
jgi:flagellar motility protein MotE (MotC chaperone)